MIKLQLRHLNSEVFQRAITKLVSSNSFSDFKSSYNMSKIARRVWKETRAAHQVFQSGMERFYEKDADGKFIPATPEQNKETGTMFKIKDGMTAEFIAKLNDMLDTEVQIDCHPVDPETIGATNITPQEAGALEVILAAPKDATSSADQLKS